MRRELGRDLIASAVDRSVLVGLIAALMMFSIWSLCSTETKIKKPLHLNQKGWNGQRTAVSPFDGVNRIRFKGSPEEFRIAECEFRIFKTSFRLQFAIRNSNFVILPGLSAPIFADRGSPETPFSFQSVGEILEPFRPGGKPKPIRWRIQHSAS